MKKWLIWCLTVLAMVCLIPGIVLKAAAETVPVHCAFCGIREEREARRYEKYDSNYHKVYVTECQNCHNDGNITHLQVHSGGTQGPTCTEGKICEKCGAEYGVLGHDWGAWTPNYASNGTHTRSCTNYCREVDIAKCTGGKATCSAKAVCEVCGGEYGEKDSNNHDRVHHEAKAPTCTDIGWDAFDTCKNCDYTDYQEIPALKHNLVYYKAKDPTCTEPGCDAYETCSRCDYTTYVERPALKHDLRQRVIKAPTCTQMGWAYENCSRCDYFATPLLPVLNHDLEQHAAKAPTCTEIGWNAYKTCSRCDYTTYAELPILGHDYQAVTVEPTCEADGYTIFTCSRCKDSYTADPTDQLGHQFGAWFPNGTGAQSASCLRDGCAHTGSTDCRKFTFRTAEGETLTFCPVCGQAENAAQLEKIEAATAWANSGSLSAEDVTARTNGEYLSVAFETAGSLTQPTGRVRLALPAGLLEGKTLVRIAPDGTQAELPFETERGTIILTLDFANSELPVMLFRLVPQPTAL